MDPRSPTPNTWRWGSFAAFIKAWIEEEYPDHCEDIPAEETGLYETLLRNWAGSDDLMAEEFVKFHGWSYAQAKEFEESLSLLSTEKKAKWSNKMGAEKRIYIAFSRRVKSKNRHMALVQFMA